jgi:hypothetical protein
MKMSTLLKTRNAILLLILVVLGAYYPAIFAPLNSVDDPGMYHFLLNADAFSIRELLFPKGSGTYYRPLLAASFFVDKYAWGLQESFMHLQNVILHLCNTLLVFLIARRVGELLGVRSPVPSFLAPFFFAMHPLNTEAVTWISARTDLLACLFVLLSTWVIINRTYRRSSSILAACCLFIACLAKETAIFFLPAALIMPFFTASANSGNESLRSRMLAVIPHITFLAVAGVGYFILRSVAFSRGDGGVARVMTHVTGDQSLGVFTTLRLMLKAAGFYVKKLFVPFPLNFGINHVSDLYIILGIALVVIICRILMRRTLPGFFIISAFSVGVSALIVPLLRVTWTPLAERYMYIPCAFFLVGIIYIVYFWKMRFRYRKLIAGTVATLAAVSIYGTASRVVLWQDNLALFQDTVRKSPDFLPAQNQYAHALYYAGSQNEAAAFLNSMQVPKDVINFQFGMVSKAAACMHEGNYAEAREILHETLKNPGKHEVMIIQRLLKLNELEIKATKSAKGGFYSENVKLLSRLYDITGDTFYLYRLGQIHLFNGKRMPARDVFCRVVALAPEKMYYRTAARKLLQKLPE